MAKIVLINPKFEISFFGYEHALRLLGKRANMPVAALPLLAALTPAEHEVTLIDENVETIDFARCARADIVGVTGMIVQRHRMREILTELKRRQVYTVVGGPWITVSEGYFDGLADVVFLGEAEETWPRFLADWQEGRAARRYQQSEKTDMTRVPPPRLDLLKTQHYAFGSIQFSRGCPFTCEFCDIIVMFGRRPRLKTAAQIIAELEVLRAHDQIHVFIVDDNLIGNKKAIKGVLRELVAWQRANGYPIVFTTEASIDLADDEELMGLMVDANITCVFVGIESPNEASLRETRKLQNVRPGGTMIEKVHRIQLAGMEVFAGMIVGFDNDDETAFEAHRNFIEAARINIANVGMLSAIPSTPLHARLAAANRLDLADPPAYGTNVVPLQMSREALSNGYVQLMAQLYEPQAFFARLDKLYLEGRIEVDAAWRRYSAQQRWRGHVRSLKTWLIAFGCLALVLTRVPEKSLRTIYRRHVWRALLARRNPFVAMVYAIRCAIHYHMHCLVQTLTTRERPLVNMF
ncbi:MAG: radical SAM protein [Xanthobacteraceae bacterium]